MAFKFKDLMINVAPAAAGKLDPQLCFDPSFCGWGSWCGWQSWCGWYSCGYPSRHCLEITYLPQAEAHLAAGGPAPGAGVAAVPLLMCPANTGYAGAAEGACVLHTTATFTVCQHCSIAFTCFAGTCFAGSCGWGSCGRTITVCPTATEIGPTPTVVPDPTTVGNQLTALKAQLQEALAEIDKRQKALDESLRPQSVSEVEELQGKMREAMSELDKRKAELQKKPEKPSK